MNYRYKYLITSLLELRIYGMTTLCLRDLSLRVNSEWNESYIRPTTFFPERKTFFPAITRCLSCQFSGHSDMCPAYCMASCGINKGPVPATCHSLDFNKQHVPGDISPRLVPSCIPTFKNNQWTNVDLNESLKFWNCERYLPYFGLSHML